MKHSYTGQILLDYLGSILVLTNTTMPRHCVMHIIGDLHTGGAETMLVKLLSGIDKERLESIVVTMRVGGSLQEKIESLGIPVFCIRLSGLSNMLAGLWRLRAYLIKYRPQLIQGWMYHGSLLASVAGMLTFNETPVVWNIRHSLHDVAKKKILTSIIIRLGAWMSFMPTKIIYNSITSSSQHHAIGYARLKTVHVPNGFNTSLFQPSAKARYKLRRQLKLNDEVTIIGLIARYHPIKDFQNFVEAAAILSAKYSNVHFVLAGRGVDAKNRELMQQIRHHYLDNRFHLLGEVSDTAEITAGFDIATSCSRGEAFSNTIGEAMSCCVPCVVTNVGDSAMIVANTGVVVPPRDTEKLAAGWESILELNRNEWQILGTKARERILEKYSIPAIVAQYEALYENMVCAAMKISGSTAQVGESQE